MRASLDVDAMDRAARSLVGLHDFAAYCKPRPEATTIRTLLEFDWRRDEWSVLVANVKADAFCHSMVRALVGACVAVGEGRLAVEEVERLRDAGERTSAFKVLEGAGPGPHGGRVPAGRPARRSRRAHAQPARPR